MDFKGRRETAALIVGRVIIYFKRQPEKANLNAKCHHIVSLNDFVTVDCRTKSQLLQILFYADFH